MKFLHKVTWAQGSFCIAVPPSHGALALLSPAGRQRKAGWRSLVSYPHRSRGDTRSRSHPIGGNWSRGSTKISEDWKMQLLDARWLLGGDCGRENINFSWKITSVCHRHRGSEKESAFTLPKHIEAGSRRCNIGSALEDDREIKDIKAFFRRKAFCTGKSK